MMRYFRNGGIAFVVLVSVGLSAARGGQPPLMPPGEPAFGKTYQEWGMLWTEWAVGTYLGGGSDIGQTVDGVFFLPGNFTPGDHEFHITLGADTPFVVAPFFIYGERYDHPDVRDDLPQDIVDLQLFETANILTVFDGETLLDGSGTELSAYMYGPTYFDDPIVYSDPQFRFMLDDQPVNALAALFTQGIATVYSPLSVGEHTLRNSVQSPFFGNFEFTYHLTVVPEPGSLVMMGLGVGGLVGYGWRRGRRGA